MKHFNSNPEAQYELMEIFEKDSLELYWLAYLITGNTDRSVQAFDRALDFNEEENPVFGGFMGSWARKLIIVEALGTIEKELKTSIQRTARLAEDETMQEAKWTRRAHIAKEDFEDALVSIDAFPRCAMLLTTFEGMSIRSASILLNASEALTSAAQRMGIVQLTRNLVGRDERNPYRGSGLVPVPSLG